jgi:hypothetical protein
MGLMETLVICCLWHLLLAAVSFSDSKMGRFATKNCKCTEKVRPRLELNVPDTFRVLKPVDDTFSVKRIVGISRHFFQFRRDGHLRSIYKHFYVCCQGSLTEEEGSVR